MVRSKGIFFNPNKPEINHILDKLMNRDAIKIDTNIAQVLSRYKKIRLLREKNHLFIGWDRDKHISILYKPYQVTMKKKGNGYLFNFF